MPLCSKCPKGSHPRVNNKLLTKTYAAWLTWSPISSLTPPPCLSLAHSAAATPTSLLRLKPTGHIFNARALHLPFPAWNTHPPNAHMTYSLTSSGLFSHATFSAFSLALSTTKHNIDFTNSSLFIVSFLLYYIRFRGHGLF